MSAFGFSGTNAHVILEQAPPVETTDEMTQPPQAAYLVPLAGRSESTLRQAAAPWAEHLAAHPEVALADVAYTAGVGRMHATQQRLAIVAPETTTLQASLRAVAAGAPASGMQCGTPLGSRPRVAFVFPGQGAQRVGMGAELFEAEPVFRAALEHCDGVLRSYLDVPLLAVLYPERFPDARVGSSEAATALLRQTAYTQPALFALGYALAELWRSWGVEPAAVLGHSVGELVAACVAGVFDVDDGLRLVATRGRVLQALPSGGAMAAVRTSQHHAAQAIAPYTADLAIAAVNAPDQIVLAGASQTLERVLAELSAEGIVVTRLAVSHAFHSPLVEPALTELEQVAADVRSRPAHRARLIGGLTGQVWAHDQAPDASYWRQHARDAVQFGRAVTTARELGCDAFIELGPGSSLLGAARANLDADDAASIAWLPSLRQGQPERASLLQSLGTLYTRGAQPHWSVLAQPGHGIPLPTTPFERKRYWLPTPTPTPTPTFTTPNRLPTPDTSHPLLGRRVPAALQQTLFEATLSASALPLLDDHRVGGSSIVPAAGLIEMAMAAGRARFGDADHELVDLAILSPLVVGDPSVTAQLVLEPTKDGNATFHIASASESPDGQSWTTHATGSLRLAITPTPPASESIPELRVRCTETRSIEDHYAALRELGLDLGPSLQAMRGIWRRDGEALGRIKLPDSEAAMASRYELHPTLCDAGLQALAAALPDLADRAAYLPVGADRIRIHARPNAEAELWVHATLLAGSAAPGESFGADIRILDERGSLVADIGGIRLKRASETALRHLGGDDPANLTYEIQWQPLPRAASDVSTALAGRRLDLMPFQDGLRHLDALSAAYAGEALGQLGWRPADGAIVIAADLTTRLSVQSNLTELVDRSLEDFCRGRSPQPPGRRLARHTLAKPSGVATTGRG